MKRGREFRDDDDFVKKRQKIDKVIAEFNTKPQEMEIRIPMLVEKKRKEFNLKLERYEQELRQKMAAEEKNLADQIAEEIKFDKFAKNERLLDKFHKIMDLFSKKSRACAIIDRNFFLLCRKEFDIDNDNEYDELRLEKNAVLFIQKKYQSKLGDWKMSFFCHDDDRCLGPYYYGVYCLYHGDSTSRKIDFELERCIMKGKFLYTPVI